MELLEPLIPAAKPRSASRSRNLEHPQRHTLPLSEGCRWRSLPGDFPAWQTVYTYSQLAHRRDMGEHS